MSLEYDYNNAPKCPHCDNNYENYRSDCYEGGEEEDYMECPYCEKEYYIYPCIEITFSTKKKED